MSKAIIPTEDLGHIAEQIEADFVEQIHISAEDVIGAHHKLGAELCKYEDNVTALVQLISERGSIGQRTLWDCRAFYKEFPNLKLLDKVPELAGKNRSWNKIKTHMKPKSEKEEKLCTHECEYHPKLTLPRKSLGGGKI